MYFGRLFAPFLEALGGILEAKRRSTIERNFGCVFGGDFEPFLGSIFDQRLVLENRFFFDEKQVEFGSKNGGKFGSQKAPPKKVPLALFGTLRTLGALGRSWSPQGVFWGSFGNPLASHGLLVAPPWHPYGFPWAHFGSCWLRAASPTCPWPDL